MRKNFVGAGLIIGVMLSGPASAADIARPVYKAPVAAPPPAFSWTGFHVGGHVGAARARSRFDDVRDVLFPGFLTTTFPAIPGLVLVPSRFANVGGVGATDTGFIAGGQVGYDWQVGNFVVGFEGDASWVNARPSVTQAVIDPFGIQTLTGTYTTEIDWTASLRARAGVAFDRVLLYATGGAAFVGGEVNSTFTLVNPLAVILVPATGSSGTTTASSSFSRIGWTVGGGIEWAFADNWSLAGEYRFSHFGSRGVRFATTDPSNLQLVNVVSPGMRLTMDQATLRLNYRFR